LTEETDAIVIVVSEETSAISMAIGGHLMRNLTAAQVRDLTTGRQPRPAAEHPAAPVSA
jgi:hypothetical protein